LYPASNRRSPPAASTAPNPNAVTLILIPIHYRPALVAYDFYRRELSPGSRPLGRMCGLLGGNMTLTWTV
jgi:hypothetical protein